MQDTQSHTLTLKNNNLRPLAANVAVISFTAVASHVKLKSKGISLVPVLVPLNLLKASSHLWYKIKTFHLLFLLTFLYSHSSTVQSLPDKKSISLTSPAFQEKPSLIYSTSPCITLSHFSHFPLAINLYALLLSYSQMKTIAG